MTYQQYRLARLLNTSLVISGATVLVAGAILGWLVPRLVQDGPILAQIGLPVSSSAVDQSAYLGANITALSVLIAVVVSRSGGPLQSQDRYSAAASGRALLEFLTFFLACALSLTVSLVYLIVRPSDILQLWQVFVWFGAILLLTLGYLWSAQLASSLNYGAFSLLDALKRVPVSGWESQSASAMLPAMLTTATARVDLDTVRQVTRLLARFLVAVRDVEAEARDQDNRLHYRALKNLLTGATYGIDQGPNATAYAFGALVVAITLQAIALGQQVNGSERNLYSGVLRQLRSDPSRLDALFTGVRHALCRPSGDGPPYLLAYWAARRKWTPDDPRRTARIGEALAYLHSQIWTQLRQVSTPENADDEAVTMLSDLYRDLMTPLVPLPSRARGLARDQGQIAAVALLDSLHESVHQRWPPDASQEMRAELMRAYETARAGFGRAEDAD